MSPVLAHIVSSNGLPLPRWLLAYLVGFEVLLVAAWARATAPRQRWPEPASVAPRRETAWSRVAAAIGVVLYLGLLVIGALTKDDYGAFVTVTVISIFWIGGLTVAPLIGDWFSPFDPFPTLARLVPDGEPDDTAPTSAAAVFVFGFLWFWFAYATRLPNDHEVTVFLLLYTVAVLACGVRWGRAWVRENEGFGATFALIGSLAPLGPDPATGRLRLRSPLRGTAERGPRPGTFALASVLLGGAAYDGLSQTSWWTDEVVAGRVGLAYTVEATIGLLWTIVIVMVITLAACRLVARLTDREVPDLNERVAGAIAVLAVGGWIAYELPQLLIDAQNFVALVSDPMARGWDLFGTVNHLPDPRLVSLGTEAWLSMIAMILSAAGAAVLTVEAAFATLSPRRAARAVWPLAVGTTLLASGTCMLLVGT